MRTLQVATLVICVVMVRGAPRVGDTPPVVQTAPVEKKVRLVEEPPVLPPWPCQMTCPDEYRPVCAIDESGELKTFPSLCYLEQSRCKRQYFAVVKEGEC